MLAYGGGDGHIYLLPNYSNNQQQQQVVNSSLLSNDNSNNKGDMTSKLNTPILLASYDDIPRSMAVSSDGLRLVIGFESGETRVFFYDDNDENGNVDKLGVAHHPFVDVGVVDKAIDKANGDTDTNNNSGDDSDDDNGGFFTQSQEQSTSTKFFHGPRSELAIRQLAFDPRSSSTSKEYYLAIGSESGDTPLRVVNVYDAETASKWFLEGEGGDVHGGAGVRSVAYSTTAFNNDNKSSGDGKQWLTTLGMDGKLTVWDVSSPLSLPEEWEHVHSDFVVSAKPDTGSLGSDAADKACQLVWGQVGGKSEVELVVLPGKTDVQVRVIPQKRGSGEEYVECFKKQQFVMDLERGHKDSIVVMAFEPVGSNGGGDGGASRKVVTAARDGKLLLWELTCEEEEDEDDSKSAVVVGGSLVKELSMVRGTAAEGIPVITSIVWIGNVLYVAHEDGEISVVSVSDEDVLVVEEEEMGAEEVEANLDDESLMGADDVDDSIKAKEGAMEESSHVNVKVNSRVLEDDDDDDDDDDLAQQGRGGASKFIDDEADAEDDDDDVTASMNVEKDTANQNGDDDDDKTQPIADDNNDYDDNFDFENHNDPLELGDVRASTNYSFPPLQPAFAPSSTPIGDSRRILCWNHMGVLTLRPDVEIDGNNLVDISFHDNAGLVGGRRPITFTDNVGFILGTLGDEGGLFASDLMEEEDDDDFDEDGLTAGLSETTRKAVKRSQKKLNGNDSAKGSSVYFHRFDTFGKTSDKDWVYALPDGERVLGCATGSGWCGVMTSRRLLRLFTVGGIQGPIIWLPGEPVTIVGRDRFMAVIYHRSMSPMQDGTQLLGYSIIDGVNGTTVATGDVSALSPGASLTWAGFTESCALTVMDSDGMLSLLARPNNELSSFGNWVPFLDTVGLKKSISDNFWPVEVNGGRLVCVLLRGGKEHPDAARRPVTTTLKLRMPMATCLSMKSGVEEEASVRANIALDQRKIYDDVLVSEGKMDSEDIEEEYDMMCRQVDKITLKLFNTFITARKVERALDLANRFHTEKTFDIAIMAADRMSLGRLCEKLEEMKNQKFPPLDEDFGDEGSYDSGMDERRSVEDEPKITSRQQLAEMQRISPDALHTPQKGRSRHSTDEESPPAESLKRKFDDDEANKSSKRRVNPFAKKRLESPAKGIMKLPLSPARPTLSKAKSRLNARR
mmetsp:Transcript_11471/g.19540  ORF Transcript_11471/g.19540 Transcript_11471/m.19540 type:complete len:1185 (-) Transcript_11471:118-3672(-)